MLIRGTDNNRNIAYTLHCLCSLRWYMYFAIPCTNTYSDHGISDDFATKSDYT